jgi:DNA polymerase III subunit gamma/tau
MSDVLALKYRPQSFDEVIGQDGTVSQLVGAIDKGQLGHALIFAGTRGCGKTTSARIVAKELNPSLSDAELQMVVHEVDAASNTGVDNVRELIETIRYSSKGHKVIILDEAHMLSKNAFNALLKTLEEPPPATTFILSTTEPHKLLPTVRSRCATYEFNDVDVDTLVLHYTNVANKEDLKLSDEVLHDVAIKAEGSVRDGLTILQKYMSGEVVESHASVYFDLVSALYQADVATALALVGELRSKEDGRVIIQTLEKWFYWCSLENFGMKTPARQHFPGDAPVFDLTHLQSLFNTCLDVERNFSATPNSKSVLEMGIIRLCL